MKSKTEQFNLTRFVIPYYQHFIYSLHRSTYFPCIEEKFDRAVFAGTIKVPPSVDLEKITSMPLFIFDSAQVWILKANSKNN